MTNSQSIRRLVAGFVRQSEGAYRLAKGVENRTERLRHSVAKLRPGIIKPRPYKIMISLTAQCNARCIGCRYGRDFMPGHQLDWPTIKDLLDDAKQAGFYSIRLYGGEPLLHPDLPKIVAYCVSLGLRPYVTTNASLLDSKIDELVAAGLRDITVGFYGVGDAYDEYVQRPGLYAKVEQGLAAVRDRHGDLVEMQMNWLLMKPTATPEAFHQAREVAERYHMKMRVDLVHYSLPYFQEGAEGELQFTDRDRPQIEAVVAELTDEIKRTCGAHPSSRPREPHCCCGRLAPLDPPRPGGREKIDVLRCVDLADQFVIDFVWLYEFVTISSERSGDEICPPGTLVRECDLAVVELESVVRPVDFRGDDSH